MTEPGPIELRAIALTLAELLSETKKHIPYVFHVDLATRIRKALRDPALIAIRLEEIKRRSSSETGQNP